MIPFESLPWVAKAKCVDADPETFYPDKGQPATAAKEVCAGCPVIEECLDYAMANNERFGVWGGLSEPERKKLRGGRRERARPEHGTSAGYRQHHRLGEQPCTPCVEAERLRQAEYRERNPRPPRATVAPAVRHCSNCDLRLTTGQKRRHGRCEACARYWDRNRCERPRVA